MNWKDTVIDCSRDCPDAGTELCCNCNYGTAYDEGCKTQAEITWDKAIKEVVDWLEENDFYPWMPQSHYDDSRPGERKMWQAQLKEWGIDG